MAAFMLKIQIRKRFFIFAGSFWLFAVLALASVSYAQRPLIQGLGSPKAEPASVRYLYPEQVSLPAGKATPVVLHFEIAPGLHINAHKPLDKDLIPAEFTIAPESGVVLKSAIWPKGVLYSLPADPATKLLVYAADFTVDATLVAQPGEHLVEAKFRYQACDNKACMPPRTIPVVIDVFGK